MFYALMKSCTKTMCNCLNIHLTKINMQELCAPWHILKILTSRNTIAMKEFQTELSNLLESLSAHNYHHIKIALELHRKILDYTKASGPTFTIYDQVMRLCAIPCTAFVQELQIYKVDQKTTQKQFGANNSPCPLDLLLKIQEMIKTLDATNQWPFHMGGKNHGKRKTISLDTSSSKKKK